MKLAKATIRQPTDLAYPELAAYGGVGDWLLTTFYPCWLT